jgi:hypothetical protein
MNKLAKQLKALSIHAGGANTNKNGLSYEKLTDLHARYTIIASHTNHQYIQFKNKNTVYTLVKKNRFLKYLDKHIDASISKGHGCKNPDECFINEHTKTIFIIEKKFQTQGGSVCEKIQTAEFKMWQYSRMIPDYKIVYIYCLSDWFKCNCIAELQYLDIKGIPVFYGNDPDYKKKVVDYIINYKQSPP